MFKQLLPKEIVSYIYSYDDTYKKYFSQYVLYLLDKQKFYPLEVLPSGSYMYSLRLRKFVCKDPSF